MGRMKLKNTNKKKRKIKVKIVFYLMIIYVSFAYTFYNFMKDNKNISNEEFINMLVSGGNANILSKYKIPNLVNSSMIHILNIDFTDPKSILNATILGSGNKKDNIKGEINIEFQDDYSNLEELKETSEYINDPNPKKIDEPLIYIYNSHQLEDYSNSNLEMYGITPNVLMASYLFREKLAEYGIQSIVEETNMSDILDKNNWNYSYSYVASRGLIQENKNKYGSLKYFIDIHRDSMPKENTTVVINGTYYAKVLFVIGQDYDSWEDNYKFANDINNLLDKYYNTLSKGIITKTGYNVNGVYNQDIDSHVILIEVGGVGNNIDEVNNTIGAIADVFNKYIRGE